MSPLQVIHQDFRSQSPHSRLTWQSREQTRRVYGRVVSFIRVRSSNALAQTERALHVSQCTVLVFDAPRTDAKAPSARVERTAPRCAGPALDVQTENISTVSSLLLIAERFSHSSRRSVLLLASSRRVPLNVFAALRSSARFTLETFCSPTPLICGPLSLSEISVRLPFDTTCEKVLRRGHQHFVNVATLPRVFDACKALWFN